MRIPTSKPKGWGEKTYRVTRQLGKRNLGENRGMNALALLISLFCCVESVFRHTRTTHAHILIMVFGQQKTTYHAHYYYYHYLSGKKLSLASEKNIASSAVVNFVGSVSFVCSSCVVLFPVVGASLIPKFRHNRSFPSHLFKLFRNSKGNV